jgi:hypothetical protein
MDLTKQLRSVRQNGENFDTVDEKEKLRMVKLASTSSEVVSAYINTAEISKKVADRQKDGKLL